MSARLEGVRETEADFATWFEDWLNLKGYRWAHFRPARTAKGWRTAVSGHGAGFPDYLVVKKQSLWHGEMPVSFVELKSERGKVGAAQLEWVTLLNSVGIPAFVFRPSQRQSVMETYQ